MSERQQVQSFVAFAVCETTTVSKNLQSGLRTADWPCRFAAVPPITLAAWLPCVSQRAEKHVRFYARAARTIFGGTRTPRGKR